MANLPSGTVDFLFTDVEGSTRLAQQCPAARLVLFEQQQAIDSRGGFIFRVVEDSFSITFHTATEAPYAHGAGFIAPGSKCRSIMLARTTHLDKETP
jgi:class 3 adenylate cyclase